MAEDQFSGFPIAEGAINGTSKIVGIHNGSNVRFTAEHLAQIIGANALVGEPNGLAALGIDGKVPLDQLPEIGGISFAKPLTLYVETNGDDTSGTPGNPSMPFATINAALDAITDNSSTTTIMIGAGTFPSISASKYKDHVTLIGTGKPDYNWVIATNGSITTEPTKLIGGTIIRGGLSKTNIEYLKFESLGFDVGPDFVGSGGAIADCLSFGGTSNRKLRGMSITNCAFLGSSYDAQYHCLLLESCTDVYVDNVSTYFNSHGVAIKSVGGIVTNIQSCSHQYDALIIKSDDYAECQNVRASGITIRRKVGTFSGGIVIQQSSITNAMFNISVSNVLCSGDFCVKVNRSASGSAVFTGISADGVSGIYTSNGNSANAFEIQDIADFRGNNLYANSYLRGFVPINLTGDCFVSNSTFTSCFNGFENGSNTAFGTYLSNVKVKGNSNKDIIITGASSAVYSSAVLSTNNTGSLTPY